jgi:MurNAc alpha-1-phosphate uridylyltransferase
MVLAAGRGERMRPLTDRTPKALLTVRGKPLIVYHLEKLSRLGVREVVINLAWLGDQIRAALGSGDRWKLRIHYSDEGREALETGGGIFRALPLLGPEPFLLINADIFSDFDLGALHIAPSASAQLALVANPPERPKGDFALRDGLIQAAGTPRWTYACFALLRPELFEGCSDGRFPLRPLFDRAIALGKLGGQLHTGAWSDVGTVERLTALQ